MTDFCAESIHLQKSMKNAIKSLTINLALLLFGSMAMFSGLLLQVEYHMGNHAGVPINKIVLTIHYHGWSGIHKGSIVLFSMAMFCHFYLHWQWYRTVIKKRLFAKNAQVITLTVLFVVVAVTGIVPWMVQWWQGSHVIRRALVEIHDKLALVLCIYLVLHVGKRAKWFISAIEKPIAARHAKKKASSCNEDAFI